MKIKMTISFIILFSMTINVVCQTNTINSQAKEVYLEEKILDMLNEFYTSYITENSKMAEMENKTAGIEKLNSIKRKYCTIRLLNKIDKQNEDAELDADPFLKSQDFNIKWSKTLKFRKDSKNQNMYIVSYSYYDNYKHTNNQITIKLIIVKQRGCYRIDSVW
ncbi:MAG: DUF3828 domain-containing protein [Paludibacter sp.]|nr:DUF3828 domain-containing protein [Paludibacter sp.]